MAATEDTKAITADQALRTVLERLSRMRSDVLLGLLPMLADLVEIGEGAIAEPSQRRLAKRLFCIQRYRQLRRKPENSRLNESDLVALIDVEARQITPAWRCSRRSLQEWIRAWNAVADDGLSAGWRGLIRPSWVNQLPERSEKCTWQGRRSPEAIAYFKRLYVGGRGKSLRVCHEMTLNAARRRGWNWPRTVAATRAWLSGGEEGKKQRAKRGSTRVRNGIGRGSKKIS